MASHRDTMGIGDSYAVATGVHAGELQGSCRGFGNGECAFFGCLVLGAPRPRCAGCSGALRQGLAGLAGRCGAAEAFHTYFVYDPRQVAQGRPRGRTDITNACAWSVYVGRAHKGVFRTWFSAGSSERCAPHCLVQARPPMCIEARRAAAAAVWARAAAPAAKSGAQAWQSQERALRQENAPGPAGCAVVVGHRGWRS